MPRFVRQGKIQFVPLFVFIVKIVMKISNNETVGPIVTETVNYEDNNKRNHRSTF